ncbi:MAG TPA: diacylglycerol kinase family protein, partial [Gemmatimonadales bacterium]|nr:diacylglycerol kinase family protein [Gemmatimonadales bacterium]
ATALVLVVGGLTRLTRLEWCALVFAIALVWIAEGVNTALEKLADAAVPERNDLVAQAKDVAAGAVLIAAFAAVAVGALLFVPRLLAL